MSINLLKTFFIYLLGSISLSLFPFNLNAQVSFNARASSTKVGVSQQFTVTYSLSGEKSEAFERPPFSGFRLLGQSSVTGGGSMQMFVNGQWISSGEGEQSWTFTLMPTAVGTFDIPPAKVKVNGSWMDSPSLRITVVSSNQAPSPSQSQTQTQSTQPGSTQQQTSPSGQSSGLKPDDVIITASADKNSAWVGEPVIITYRIYTKVSIPSYAINKIPAFDGFWSENLTDPNTRPQQSEEILNGQRYTSALLRRIIVYPQRSGNLSLESLEVEVIARIARQRQQPNAQDWMNQMFGNFFTNPFGSDPFSSFPGFGSAYEDIKTVVKSNSVTLNIRELPSKNRTADFSGQVGKYTLEAWFDKDRILIDDALNLIVKISGNGNMSLLHAPDIQFPKSFESYEPIVEDNTKVTSGGFSGNKVFNYLIVPREPGNFTIPSIRFTYFDPSKNDYVTLSTDEFKLQVIGQHSGITSLSEVDKDIRFIQLSAGTFRKINSYFFASPLHIIFFLLPLAGFFVFIFVQRRKIQLRSNEQLLRYKQATKTARKRLKKASKLLGAGQINEFYEETARAIWAYLGDRFSIQQAELSVDNVLNNLQESGVEQNILTELKQTLEFCEYIRFAPGANSATPGEVLEKAGNTIRQMEQHLYQIRQKK
jgi:hypothetical protein